MIGDFLDKYTFDYLMEVALSKVPNTMDKREGSIIYDALAPACYVLAEYFMRLKDVFENTFAETASGEYLDKRVAEQGITRFAATNAVKKGRFETVSGLPMDIEIGSRFSTITETDALNYVVTDRYIVDGEPVAGEYLLTCETKGTIGNGFVGNIMPITYISGLGTAIITDLITPARDTETDSELRLRYFTALSNTPFGGNVAQYLQQLLEIDGVGAAQIYPVWNGGGTVKCSIIDASYNIVTDAFIESVQEMFDPNTQGEGLGLAPIGHSVTITTATAKTIDISTNITLMSGYTVETVRPLITNVIEEYLLTLRKAWGVANDLNQYNLGVYVAKINAAILSISGIANVTDTKINGVAADLTLTETAAKQELPVLGGITLNGE